ncbi:zinc finger CCCH domain-containing protein 48-like [Vicia villosa]|uniref:zinc finger CCCH domain-containing protein 48-like n=1 Tax=Vicia villosa TaxID=3911 RepID=UPI00273C138C|nr:zinc finger CCCH domain-containing protein 48-like [Vicia villosa]XP_058759772.1 zinc finger CCCH domain-containing protein 48-like [Vicia villosa]
MDMKVKRFNRTERVIGTTCIYWLQGRCNRNPCRFLHSETPSIRTTASYRDDTASYHNARKRCSVSSESAKRVLCRKTENDTSVPKHTTKKVLSRNLEDDRERTQVLPQNPSTSICKYWMNDNCVHGDKCRNLHSWSYGDGFSILAKLQGHKKLATGIALPNGSDKLYSGSADGTLRSWDCHTGQCANLMNLGAEATSLINEGPWIFVGLPNIVKAWNIQTASQFTLDGPKGRVLAMTVGNDTLLAGAEDGVISAWKGSSKPNSPFELVASLCGHTKSVVCLTAGAHNKMLYSGSKDQSIKVWDLDTFECKMTLNAHADEVTSLLCWDNFLLSGSSDRTIKVWYKTMEETLEVAYSHDVENGVVALSGMTDPKDKPIVFCSTRDNSVRLYELPSFVERGRLFAKQEVGLIDVAPGGLFFTGDRTGMLTVWKWLEEPKVAASS